jgi:hypothetical protein
MGDLSKKGRPGLPSGETGGQRQPPQESAEQALRPERRPQWVAKHGHGEEDQHNRGEWHETAFSCHARCSACDCRRFGLVRCMQLFTLYGFIGRPSAQ